MKVVLVARVASGLLCFVLAASASATKVLNDTGMTLCLSHDGNSFVDECAGTGQDAEFGRDAARPSDADGHAGFRFRKVCNNGEPAGTGACPSEPPFGGGGADWGCTEDRATKLVWEVKTDDGGPRDKDLKFANPLTGNGYVDQVNTSGLCGATDWRVPTRNELQGIVDYSVGLPSGKIDSIWFPHSVAARTWTSSPVGRRTFAAYAVDFLYGHVAGGDRSELLSLRLVRGGQRSQKLIASTEEVLDKSTGFVWRRCAAGQTWNGRKCDGAPTELSWQRALAYAQDEAARTGVAWRLPNVKELSSIVSTKREQPTINRRAFPGAPAIVFWTSTMKAMDTDEAWAVAFSDGEVHEFKMVRGGVVGAVRLVRTSP